MKKSLALALLVFILLAAFFLRQYKLFGLPFFGDEVDSGDIALDILQGKIAPFYPHADGREGLYFYSMAVSFAVLGDSEIANRWPSVAWSMIFVAMMYVYG
jgi:predicted membrane-bound mannosyltransferase